MSSENRPTASALDMIVPTNPLAAVSCYTGIFSILFCPIGLLLGPLAVVLGIVALKKWTMPESQLGATTSKIRLWVGIVTGSIGTIVGLIAAISILSSLLRR